LVKANLPSIRRHDLRHTAATLRLQAGANVKVVQELLGHSSITLTLDTYSHVTPGMQRESANAMNTILRAEMEAHAG
jgi:integrase